MPKRDADSLVVIASSPIGCQDRRHNAGLRSVAVVTTYRPEMSSSGRSAP
jgi:hypothetical protein